MVVGTMHPRVEHPNPRVEFTCIVLNATLRNVINDFTVKAKDSGPYYTMQCVILTGSYYTTTERMQFFF